MKNLHRLFNVNSLSRLDQTNIIYQVSVPSTKNITIHGMHLTDFVITLEHLERLVFGHKEGLVKNSLWWANFLNNAASDDIIEHLGRNSEFSVYDADGTTVYSQNNNGNVYWGTLPQLLNRNKFYLPRSIAQFLFENMLTSHKGMNDGVDIFMHEYKQNLVLQNDCQVPNIPYTDSADFRIFEGYRLQSHGDYMTVYNDYRSKKWFLRAMQYMTFIQNCQRIYGEPLYEFTGSLEIIHDICDSKHNNVITNHILTTLHHLFNRL